MSSSIEMASRRLPAGRKAALAAYVAEVGQVTVANLAERFDVSADTIRRDLDQLDAEGLVIRTHGGAISPQSALRPDTGVDVRLRLQTQAKDQIGALAAGLVRDGATLMINAGTTALATARHLAEHRDLTIATNSLRLATELNPAAYRDLYVFGGVVRSSAQGNRRAGGVPRSQRCRPLDSLRHRPHRGRRRRGRLRILHQQPGRCDHDAGDDGPLHQGAVLADATKFGRRLFAQIAELERADYLVTDIAPPEELAEALRGAGVEVLVPAP